MSDGVAFRRFTIPTVRVRTNIVRGALIRVALPALVGAAALAGCGGGAASTAAAAGTSASAAATGSAGLSAFETCLKQHGMKVNPGQFAGRPTGSFSPRPVPSGSPRPRPSFTGSSANAAALQACAKYAPAGFGRGGAGRAISSSALAAFKSCLTSHGVKVTGTTASAVLAEVRNATGKTATAVQTCRVLLQPAAPTPTASA